MHGFVRRTRVRSTRARGITLGTVKTDLLWSVLYLVVFTAIFFPPALISMRRRLIH